MGSFMVGRAKEIESQPGRSTGALRSEMQDSFLGTSSFQQALLKVLLIIYVGRSEFLRSVSVLATVFPFSVSE